MPRKAAPKKTARKDKAKPKARSEPLLPEGSTRKLVLAGIGLVLAAGVVIGAGVGIPALGRNAAELINTEPPYIWLKPPAWMPQDIRDGVIDRAKAEYDRAYREVGTLTPLSSEPLRAVQEAMIATGWAADVPRVERRRPSSVDDDSLSTKRNIVVIEMAWRRPVAVVRSGAFEYGARPGLRDTAVDATADVLPMSGPPESFPGLKVILNPSRLPKPIDGTDTNPAWPGQDVRDAIALLQLLAGEKFAPQIVGIDLAEHTEQRRLLIVTTTGGRVVWGMPPSGEGVYSGEVPDESKLANLRELVKATGQLDGGQQRVEIHWPGTVLIGDDIGTGGRGGQP